MNRFLFKGPFQEQGSPGRMQRVHARRPSAWPFPSLIQVRTE
ncbi:hypothetical protein RISK_004892 [Rhodopirellula islandica]|uniref:Uncharacterized protein n=1 Tax=Rhodopirellula islandica TaxID=595434 RepID=A0A0J1B9G3_RHOIS|nr:hypothetical protein RISK_004892 [Rhodopirellula islandica]